MTKDELIRALNSAHVRLEPACFDTKVKFLLSRYKNPETLTLRDQFAMAALPVVLEKICVTGMSVDVTALTAKFSYQIADAMMEAREEKPADEL